LLSKPCSASDRLGEQGEERKGDGEAHADACKNRRIHLIKYKVGNSHEVKRDGLQVGACVSVKCSMRAFNQLSHSYI